MPGFFANASMALHRRIYRISGGRLLGSMAGMKVLILTTRGRKSGKLRTIPITTLPQDDGSFLIVASNGGAPNDPAWAHNLRAHPNAVVEFKGDMHRVTASFPQDPQRQELLDHAASINSRYNDYQAKTDRPIPIVLLHPRSDDAESDSPDAIASTPEPAGSTPTDPTL